MQTRSTDDLWISSLRTIRTGDGERAQIDPQMICGSHLDVIRKGLTVSESGLNLVDLEIWYRKKRIPYLSTKTKKELKLKTKMTTSGH